MGRLIPGEGAVTGNENGVSDMVSNFYFGIELLSESVSNLFVAASEAAKFLLPSGGRDFFVRDTSSGYDTTEDTIGFLEFEDSVYTFAVFGEIRTDLL